MILKHPERVASHVSQFDLLGDDEKALSKAFAYVLAKNRQALFTFLHQIGIRVRNTDDNHLATKVEIEHFGPEGRTDIEILNRKSYHVIVECKVDSNRVYAQRTQYLSSFQGVPHRVMCFITQERAAPVDGELAAAVEHGLGELLGRELATLIGVDDGGTTCSSNACGVA
jgi:hypothetical protein